MKTVKVKNITIGENRPKICVSVTGIDKEEILNQIRKLKELSVDIIEWRADYFKGVFNIDEVKKVLLSLRQEIKDLPLIFTLRSLEEGGQKNIDLNYYKKLNIEMIKTKLIDLIDIEANLCDEEMIEIIEKSKKQDIKVILSTHHFNHTPSKEELIEKVIKMESLGADICKIAVMPNSKLDVIRLLEITAILNETCKTPIVTISMGIEGLISRMCGQVFGSCLTFAYVGEKSAPGQIHIDELREVIRIIDNNSKEMKKNKIFLIGFMGVGKTTISSSLKSALDMKEIDIDNYIENKENMTINEIFKTNGEKYFRNLETSILKELDTEDNIIVSCGGGIILKDNNIEIMKKQGYVILLEAKANTIYNRLKNSNNRPLLKNNLTEEYIRELKEKRKEQYLKAADIIVYTDNKNTEQICEEIIKNFISNNL